MSASLVLTGAARVAAVPSAVAVTVVLAFCGWALLVPAVVGLVVLAASSLSGARLPGRAQPALMQRRVTDDAELHQCAA